MDTKKDKRDFSIQAIISDMLHAPGFCFNREQFLRTEFKRFYSQEIIDKIVMSNPADVGVPPEVIEEIIKPLRSQRLVGNCFSEFKYMTYEAPYRAIGGLCILASLPVWWKREMLEFCKELLYAIQILIYIYGLPQINVENKDNKLNDEILKFFIINIGVMLGSIEAKEKFISIINILRENDVNLQIIKEATRDKIPHSLFRKIIRQTEKTLKAKFTSFGGPMQISCVPYCKDINDCLKLELYYPKYIQTLRENRSLI